MPCHAQQGADLFVPARSQARFAAPACKARPSRNTPYLWNKPIGETLKTIVGNGPMDAGD
jgi:hypothetical protein